MVGSRSKRLQKLRSEKVERTFAHVCETGGGRRSWLRGLLKVGTRYLMRVAGHNLGIIMRCVCGKGTPRSLQGLGAAVVVWFRGWVDTLSAHAAVVVGASGVGGPGEAGRLHLFATLHGAENLTFSTGC